MNNPTLTKCLQALDHDAAARARRNRYYYGKAPLAYLSPEARTALGQRFSVMTSNVCRVAVNSLAERLRVTGFTGTRAAIAWADWLRCNLDQLAPAVHRDALALGVGYLLVWADDQGRPQVTVETADQVAVVRDPASREVVAAVKRWEDDKGTKAVLFTPEKITKLASPSKGATADFTTTEVIDNALGVVPVVPMFNTDRVGGPALSELDDLGPLQDALSKLLSDLMVASETTARPRRWATGIELTEVPVLDAEGNQLLGADGEPIVRTVNPIPEGDRMIALEAADAKLGQLDGANLAGYKDAVDVILAQVMAVSALPAHFLGQMSAQPSSADALRAAEASLTARAEARQAIFGRAWEQVARLMVAIRTGAPVEAIELAVQWADPSTRSLAQEADAVVKMHAAGLLPASYALKRLGYPDDVVEQIRAARRAEALDQTGSNLAALMPRADA